MTADFRRVPIESRGPVVAFAFVRTGLVLVTLVTCLLLDVPEEGTLQPLLAGVALPWALGVLVLAVRDASAAMSLWIAAGDFLVLALIQALVPEIYAAFRFIALFFVAVHAHFQGELPGVAIAAGGVTLLIVARAIAGEGPIAGDLLVFYEVVFAAVALAGADLLGRLRMTESASRLQARELTRRTLRSESEVRRRVAESIHDGPVQELIALDMMLSAAGQAVDKGEGSRSLELIGEAREIAERNVRLLREEIVDLGPYAFEELSFAQAVENCLPVWQRRYGVEVMLTLEQIALPSEVAGHLFRITQEAVVNACRHAEAEHVAVSLRTLEGGVELRVTDDGHGFRGIDPGAPPEPGHLGLAAMRERAELLNGTLEIESSGRGTRVVVRAPLPARTPGGRSTPSRSPVGRG